MRVLLDESMDRRLTQNFDPEFEVMTVTELGWSGMKNGELLRAAEGQFDAFVTMDQGIEHQQNLAMYSLGIIVVLARSNRRKDVEPVMPDVNSALRRVRPGQCLRVPAV